MILKKHGWVMVFLAAFFCGSCQLMRNNTESINNQNSGAVTEATAENKPAQIEISPTAATRDGYQIINADSAKITVKAGAPAQETQIFYQPVTSGDRALKLKTLIPNEQNNQLFESDLKVPMDINGEMWAEIRYATGEVKETPRILIASDSARAETNSTPAQAETSDSNVAAQNSEQGLTKTDGDESARADKFTNGAITRAALQPGGGKISITVNVPAFLMTLWQDGKEIKTYYVGVGRKNYPIPIGLRTADKIIINPDWIPPNSEWVRRSSSVEPYERISADDPLNPLGKIKVPLGDAYLLHEAESPKDLGNLVSHGCVRVLRNDLFDLTELIVAAGGLPISKDAINAHKNDTKREVIKLGGAIPVDINYESMVVENGVLTIFPDVYDRKTNTVENLRAELESDGVNISAISVETLRTMLDRVTSETKFVVALNDIKAGNALEKGKIEPLTPQQAKEMPQKKAQEKSQTSGKS